MKTKLSDFTLEELQEVQESEPQKLFDLVSNMPPLKAKGLDFDENGEVIEDFSYLETFES